MASNEPNNDLGLLESNRFGPLSEEWTNVQRKKRQRHSTGGTYTNTTGGAQTKTTSSIGRETFKTLTHEDQMLALFDMINNISSVQSNVSNIDKHVHYLYAVNDVDDKRIRLLEYKTLDIEARQRQCNLIFKGLPELLQGENVSKIIRDFLSQYLGIKSEDYVIQTAFRVGSRGRRPHHNKPIYRPILVTFRDLSSVETILENTRKLRDTEFGVSRDYPKEISEARQALWGDFKAARAKFGSGNVHIRFPACLVVNGNPVRDMFPEWYNVLRGSRNSDVGTRIAESFSRFFSNTEDIKFHHPRDDACPTSSSSSTNYSSSNTNITHQYQSTPSFNGTASNEVTQRKGSLSTPINVTLPPTKRSESGLKQSSMDPDIELVTKPAHPVEPALANHVDPVSAPLVDLEQPRCVDEIPGLTSLTTPCNTPMAANGSVVKRDEHSASHTQGSSLLTGVGLSSPAELQPL